MNGSFRFLGAGLDFAPVRPGQAAGAQGYQYSIDKNENYLAKWKSVLSLHADIRASIFAIRAGDEKFQIQLKAIREEGTVIIGTLIDSGRSFFIHFDRSSIAKMTANGRTYKIQMQTAKGGWEVFAAAGNEFLALKHRPDGLVTFAVLSKDFSRSMLNSAEIIRASNLPRAI